MINFIGLSQEVFKDSVWQFQFEFFPFSEQQHLLASTICKFDGLHLFEKTSSLFNKPSSTSLNLVLKLNFKNIDEQENDMSLKPSILRNSVGKKYSQTWWSSFPRCFDN